MLWVSLWKHHGLATKKTTLPKSLATGQLRALSDLVLHWRWRALQREACSVGLREAACWSHHHLIGRSRAAHVSNLRRVHHTLVQRLDALSLVHEWRLEPTWCWILRKGWMRGHHRRWRVSSTD